MVSISTKRKIYLITGILAIIAVAKCQMVETTWHRNQAVMAEKRNNYTVEISHDELNAFTKDWPEFNKLGLLKGVNIGSDGNPDVFTWKMRIWLVYRHWDAKRFFYVRKRLLNSLEEISVRHEAENIIKQLKERSDSLALQMIDYQNKRINSQEITKDELLMFSSQEDNLREMFKQYP